MVAQNAYFLFKILLNDAFLNGTVEVKEFRFHCKLPLANHFHLKYFNCIFFFSPFTLYIFAFAYYSLLVRVSKLL